MFLLTHTLLHALPAAHSLTHVHIAMRMTHYCDLCALLFLLCAATRQRYRSAETVPYRAEKPEGSVWQQCPSSLP